MNGANSNGRLSAEELQLASWWVKNQALVKTVIHGLLIFISVLFWSYALWGLLDAYAISYPRESRITREIAVNQQLLISLEQDKPTDVSVSDVSVFSSTDDRLDMMVELFNPNEQWWAEYNYRFNLSGEQTSLRSGYILPKSKYIVTELGYKPNAKGVKRATLIVENIRWHRVDPNFVKGEYDDFVKTRMNLSFEDIKYDTDIVLGNKKIGQSSFVLNNMGAYGYWSLDLIVKLYRGSQFVAINKIKINNISPGEKRPMQIVWLENLSNISRAEIIPQINILDQSVYLPTQYFNK